LWLASLYCCFKRNYSISRYTNKMVYLIKERANFVSEFWN
jgi:hypothetical protein